MEIWNQPDEIRIAAAQARIRELVEQERRRH
jgi:hypothetical protein